MVLNVAITVISSLFSCVIAILSTIAIEKLGGTLGGVLATTPTTIVPYSVGLVLADTSVDDIDTAMFSVPIGICLTTFYLILWREVPKWSIVERLGSTYRQLAVVLPLLIVLWIGCATAIALLLLPQLVAAGIPMWASGVVGLLLSFLIGVAVIFYRHQAAPKGKKKMTLLMYLSRGVLAGVAIGVSLIISSISPVAGGVASVFPSITTTTMVMLWIQQGRELPAGAAGPMMLGNMAVSTYCMLFAVLWRQLSSEGAGAPVGLMLTAVSLLGYVFATTFVSIPIFSLLQWRKTQVETGQAGTPEEQAEAAGECRQRIEDEQQEHSQQQEQQTASSGTHVHLLQSDMAAVELGKKDEDELKLPLYTNGSS